MQEISLNKAKEYELLGINLIPGKNCVSCQKSIAKQSKPDDALVELGQIDSDPDYVNDNTDVNSQLENIGISPISNHAKAKSKRISTGKRKLLQISDVFSASVSKKPNLSCEEISEQNTTANNHCVDCKDYKQLLGNIKEKINSVKEKTNFPFNISTRQLDTAKSCILF